MEISNELRLAHDKAKYALIKDNGSIFIATLLFSLKLHWTDEIPTACTDGINLYINPDFYLAQSPKVRVSILAHEAWHVAYKDMLRVGSKNPEIWNEACDHYINHMIGNYTDKKSNTKPYEIPDTWCRDPKYAGWEKEAIYADLFQQNQQKPNPSAGNAASPGTGMGSGKPDFTKPKDPEGNPLPDAVLEANINANLVKAATAARMTGHGAHIPDSLKQELEMITNPPLCWETIFQNILSSYAKDDYSFTRFNRRYLPEFMLPSLYSEAYGEVIFGFDTSGSMTDEQCASFIGHLHYVQDYIKPEKITIMSFDTRVRMTKTFEQGDDIRSLEFEGRGGTCLEDLFTKVRELNPRLLVVYSDLDCYPITEPTPFETVWLCADNKRAKVSFGTLIHIDTRS
jgi:predicted metal-dependent peptidase